MFLFKNTDISWCTVVRICRDGPKKKKTVATLKVCKWYARNFDARLVKGFHEHCQALSSASMSNGTIKFAGEHRWSTRPPSHYSGQIGYLLTSFFLSSVSVTVSQASTITTKAITMIQSWKNHRVLHSPSIAYCAHGTADGDKFCCYPWIMCLDIKSAMHCSLWLVPMVINHLTSSNSNLRAPLKQRIYNKLVWLTKT